MIHKRDKPIFCIDFHDEGPDTHGRRRFTLFWKAERPFYDQRGRETHWGPGIRAQEFFADPRRFAPIHPEVIS